MTKFITFLLLQLFSFLSFAETYGLELKGSFKLETSDTKPVKFTLRWSEDNGVIKGTYSDDRFARFARVSGEGSYLGKTFIVSLPEEKGGVRSITLLSGVPAKNKTGTQIPVSVITRDGQGNPLTTVESQSTFNMKTPAQVAEAQEEAGCVDGFGELAGYCGIYAGILAEEEDRRNRCNLLFADAVRLELTEGGMVHLHLGEVNELINTPGHSVGRIPLNPESTRLDVMSRTCGALSGMNADSKTCKRLHLTGSFSRNGQQREFEGNYMITEEGSNLTCRYSLSMDRLQ